MYDNAVGIALLVIAGVMNANFALPMKFTRRWSWENTWLLWTVFALLVLPSAMALLTIPDLADVYVQAGWVPTLIVVACGAGWGISQVFLGLAVDAIGIGLAFAIILGISAAIGSLITLGTKHADKMFSPAGLAVIVGVAMVIAGVAICAVAGRRREAVLGTGPKDVPFARGFVFCVISGVGSALVGLGLEWGSEIVRAAKSAGAPEIWRPNAVWLPLMVAGAIPNVIYCIHLTRKNGSGARFKEAGTGLYWVFAAVMALFWFGSTVMYGVSTVELGSLGGAIAWPLYMSIIVITASLVGILSGEWRNTGKGLIRVQLAGLAVLILAVVVLSRAL